MDNPPVNKIIGVHRGQPVLMAGEQLEQARAAMIMMHGRGASARDILSLTTELQQPGFVYIAPQAAGSTWYPTSFLAALSSNEPDLTSALSVIGQLLESLSEAGITPERTILLGFSQGACLSLEFAARNARRYGGIAALSGGLIGPNTLPRDYPGSLADTAAFLGCSDHDPHIPKERVDLSADVLQRMGATVTKRIYPRMGHTVNDDEIAHVNAMMQALIAS
ncbi:alpha/beta hydrolase [Dictyobacter aurantiacus]|uniref:Phospholipase/carboxylesterase n=1 Tax=Dictyobacter aurantiacus TaxID=1936993 RepID=A0A401ZP19_9CHLR|nr:alpha/beta hydrolase [Dictyobacter aurantiacus]GCE08496.1 phospholipase/carboxylesterase [Dictyobacter aurantiacus]